MKAIILYIAEWLTSPHTITLDGWVWLTLAPVAAALFILVAYFMSFWFIGCMLRGRLW